MSAAACLMRVTIVLLPFAGVRRGFTCCLERTPANDGGFPIRRNEGRRRGVFPPHSHRRLEGGAMKLKSILIAAAIALGVLGGTAWAAQTIGSIVGVDGTIHGCYTTNTGLLRVVAEGTNCTTRELPIQWNQKGPTGDKGDRGVRGPRGDTGPPG